MFFDGTGFLFQFALPGIRGLPRPVCEAFYAAVLGTRKADRMYRNAMTQTIYSGQRTLETHKMTLYIS